MNPDDQQEIQTPDFSGEEMKMPQNAPQPIEHTKRSHIVNGPLLLGLALLLIALLGGMYYWFSTMEMNTGPTAPTPAAERPTAEENNEPESTTAETQARTMQTTSTSDEISAIEADVEATDLESLDTELNAIDAELNAALQ